MKVRSWRESDAAQFILIHAVVVVAPTLVLVGAGPLEPLLRGLLARAIAIAFLLTSALILAESLMSVRRRGGPAMHGLASPTLDLSIVIVAYLPNEQTVIEDSVRRILDDLDHPTDRLQVIVAYNTPVDLPVEQALAALAMAHGELEILRVDGSTSKAENLLAALEHVRGDVTAIIDSDHHLAPDAARRALRWFDEGYDVVQGRCCVRNQTDSLLARVVAIEFEQIYGLAHAGRSLLVDTAIFGGANGWWRSSVLRELGFDPSMLTEDIDASMRAMLAGYRLVHDRSVVSTELAPTTWRAWWSQRTRWAQGWLQVTMRHQRAVLRSPLMPWWLKGYWTILLLWRELFPIVALQIVTLIAADVATVGRPELSFDPLLAASAIVTVVSGVVAAGATWQRATTLTRETQGPWRFMVFGLAAFGYTMLRNAVALVALAKEALGDHRWVVTSRAPSAKSGCPPRAGVAASLALLAAGAALVDTPERARAAAVRTPPETREIALVDVPTTLNGRHPTYTARLALPGTWAAARGRLVLRLRGDAHLTARSRVAVTVDGLQFLSGPVKPGAQRLEVTIPELPITVRALTVTIASRLATSLTPCPPPDDPTASAQVLPESALVLRPTRRNPVRLSTVPAVLVDALGVEPAQVTVRFAHGPTPDGVVAAGVAAGVIGTARGYPGAHVRVVGRTTRPTLLIDDRPGPARIRVSERIGIPTLTVSGSGPALVAAARAIDRLSAADRGRAPAKMATSPNGTAPVQRKPMPHTLVLGGAENDGGGSAEASTFVRVAGRYALQRGNRLRLRGAVTSSVPTEVVSTVNGRVVSTMRLTPGRSRFRVSAILADRGSETLRGDLVPGDNEVAVTATALPSGSSCAPIQPVQVVIAPGATLDVRPGPRTIAEASLATWPFPLDREAGWAGSTIVLPGTPRRGELAGVIGVLAESLRASREPALPTVRFGGDPDRGADTLLLARPGSVPATLARKVAGGVGAGTLSIVRTGNRAVFLAVGAVALRPLAGSFASTGLGATTVDVRGVATTIRTPATGIVSATVRDERSTRWPLAVLGISIIGAFALVLRSRHRTTRRLRSAREPTRPAPGEPS